MIDSRRDAAALTLLCRRINGAGAVCVVRTGMMEIDSKPLFVVTYAYPLDSFHPISIEVCDRPSSPDCYTRDQRDGGDRPNERRACDVSCGEDGGWATA